jgi:hypothetical protein
MLKYNLTTKGADVTNFFVFFVTFVAALKVQRCDRLTLRSVLRPQAGRPVENHRC